MNTIVVTKDPDDGTLTISMDAGTPLRETLLITLLANSENADHEVDVDGNLSIILRRDHTLREEMLLRVVEALGGGARREAIAKPSPVNPEDAADMEAVFRALEGRGVSLNVGQIRVATDLSSPTVRRALQLLQKADRVRYLGGRQRLWARR